MRTRLQLKFNFFLTRKVKNCCCIVYRFFIESATMSRFIHTCIGALCGSLIGSLIIARPLSTISCSGCWCDRIAGLLGGRISWPSRSSSKKVTPENYKLISFSWNFFYSSSRKINLSFRFLSFVNGRIEMAIK